MPNWCSNELSIAGPKEQIRDFKAFAKKGESILDHHKFIPLPPKQKVIDKIHDDYVRQNPDDYSNSPKDWFNSGGYDWCCKNWGTKWGICHTTLGSESETTLHYNFDTAWSPPNPIIIKMGEMFPGLIFNLHYEEPGCAFKGDLIIEKGKVTTDITERLCL